MPTGWTAPVADGKITDLRTWALYCARAMGALISMRDAPNDAPIPQRVEPSVYHAQELAQAVESLKYLRALLPGEPDDMASGDYEEKTKARDAYLAKRVAEAGHYDAMIAKVEDWKGAPEGLKEFMLEQLQTGRDFDCQGDRGQYYPAPEKLSGERWFLCEEQRLLKDIERAAEGDREERERTAERNKWLAQLHSSLAGLS